jgi:ribosomal protein S18 acetylase RimI-like enzyme
MAVTSLQPRPIATEQDPRVRPVDFWRDGQSVASLLELCFQHEGIDDSGHRLIHILRNYGITQSWMMQGSLGFVWIEDGRVLGNASIQRNATRRDTWIIGNVATHPDHRGRGIATAVTDACINLALRRGARYVALQVVANNVPAQRMYRTLGFQSIGEVIHYHRAPVRTSPIPPPSHSLTRPITNLRSATWRDKQEIWRLASHNTPEPLTYAEPYDASLYHLGLRWSFTNSLNGNPEKWWVADGASGPLGAVRTRVNFDTSEHHLELMLQHADDTQTAYDLACIGLRRFGDYITKPIYAAQSRPHEATHAALEQTGFKPSRHLIHMRLAGRP